MDSHGRSAIVRGLSVVVRGTPRTWPGNAVEDRGHCRGPPPKRQVMYIPRYEMAHGVSVIPGTSPRTFHWIGIPIGHPMGLTSYSYMVLRLGCLIEPHGIQTGLPMGCHLGLYHATNYETCHGTSNERPSVCLK